MNYLVKAINGRSEVVSLELRAPDIPSARQIARHQGLRVLSLKPSYKPLLGPSWARARLSPTRLSMALLSLLDAGLNLVEGIQALTEKAAQPETRRVLERVLEGMREGMSFSQSLARLPEHFSPL
jgi:general secretion pathway protein F